MLTLKMVFTAALKSAHTAAGHANLEECLTALKGKELFNINSKPEVLPLGDTEMFDLLDVDADQRSPSRSALLRSQWKTYTEKWKQPVPLVSLAGSWEFWGSLTEAAPELVAVARDNLLKPDTSASVERIYSALTDMDKPKRRTKASSILFFMLVARMMRPSKSSMRCSR